MLPLVENGFWTFRPLVFAVGTLAPCEMQIQSEQPVAQHQLSYLR